MAQDMTTEEIDALLQQKFYGHLGCYSEGEVYVVPVTYIYMDDTIYGYTHVGKKIEMLRDNPQVCLQVEDIEGSSHWSSVICNGVYEEITDPAEIQDICVRMAGRFAQVRESGIEDPYFPIIEELNEHAKSSKKQIMYRIHVKKKSGRKEM